ncbi:MAG: hypothetical protein IJ308_04930 [Clostridia bacterium]|nr:hypothetical protein [Clostridia bacterium]
MNKKIKSLLALLMGVVMSTSIVACGDNNKPDNSGSNSNTESNTDGDVTTTFVENADYTTMDDYKAYLAADLDVVKNAIGASVSAEVAAAVDAALADGKAAIDAATDIPTAKAAYKAAAEAMQNAVPAANGTFNFSGLSAAEKTKILGQLEAYGIRNGMLGVTLFENGGYVLINDRIQLATENYISGYGFGILSEGSITADLEAENNVDWKRYYHAVEAADPGTANYLNSQGSDVGDFYSYIGASYYTTFMNSTKDGYEWVPELAVADPEPVNGLDENGQAATWRFEIRSGLKYSTNSAMTDRAAFNNREVVAEDFITPFKLLLNQANSYYRGSELANQSGAASIVGAKEYYEATKNAEKGILSDDVVDFSGVGVKVYEEEGKTYFEYTLGAPTTAYYARYYISSSLYMPIPEEFIELVGVDNYLNFNSDKTTSPVDNSLSLGAYVLERWDSGQQVVYKKNPNYVYADTKYSIPGVHLNILPAAADDKEAVIKEFLAGKVDSCGIPDTYLAEYSNDPRAKTTTGDSCFKLNMNALDQETWISLFGENGSYSQTSADKYWTVEPALSNAHFRLGLSYALNRKAFAELKGSVGTANYFSSDYMSDPENGISYNATQEHKDAVSYLTDDTDGYGFNLELSRDYFRMALDELEADGLIVPGTTENPTVIDIEVVWMYPTNQEGYHNHVAKYWMDAFNDESVTGGKYKLQFTFDVGEDYMYCYNKMLAGQYDIGFGSISGNPLDPLNFLGVNSTNAAISGDFTLNWAVNTNTLTEALVYNGQRWSYDALYQSSQQLTIVENGCEASAYELASVTPETKDDGSMVVTIVLENSSAVDALALDKLVIFGGGYSVAYNEWALDASMYTVNYDAEADTLTIVATLPASELAKVPVDANQGLDVYFTYTIGEAAASAYVTAYVTFSVAE